MPHPLSDDELERLARHARRTWGFFIAFWIFTPLAVLAIAVLEPGERTTNTLLGVILAGVLVAIALQFSERCPRCRANIGWQVRLGVPERCGNCGVALKKSGRL